MLLKINIYIYTNNTAKPLKSEDASNIMVRVHQYTYPHSDTLHTK